MNRQDMKYKLIISDIDGVWTDGSFYYSQEGDFLRKFNTRDSYGVVRAELAEVAVIVISGEESDIVRSRLKKLGIKNFALGVRDKISWLEDFCRKRNLSLSDVAFVGDDMNDFALLERVGFFACPADGYHLIREKCDLVLENRGGSGAFREFVEHLFQQEGILEELYQKYTAADPKK